MSQSPLVDLSSHRDRDLRMRTLTSLLAALSPLTGALPNTDGPAVSGPVNIQQESTASKTWAKVLNHVAQLLVREHEIVAVLPKRSGSTAHVSLLVTTDSSSDDDDLLSDEGYLIARNPRFNSPDPCPGNPLAKLVSVSSHHDLVLYLHKYRHVAYRNHVLGIECLFNAIVDAYNTYMAVLDDEDSNSTEGASPVGDGAAVEAYTHLALRTDLLNSFVTFYSIGKMHRRFHSMPFTMFHTAMKRMQQVQVEGAFGMASGLDKPSPFTKCEVYLFEALLRHHAANKYPGLLAKLSSAHATSTVPLYTQDTTWDLHRLLLSSLESAKLAVDTLYAKISSPFSSFIDLSTSLSDVQQTMDRLHSLVHVSPSIARHMKYIETILSDAMDVNIYEPEHSFSSELDTDDGVTDSIIEISLARKEKRVGEECLWLAVRYQTALESLTAIDSLPTDYVTFTLYEVSDKDTPNNEMHDWKDVIYSIYHPRESSAGASTGSTDISSQEAIKALEEWANLVENKVRATHILRSPRHKFYGSWHAEALLGTLRHVSQEQAEQTMLSREIDITPFRHTFNSIGVSKRCCPVCAKLLWLLAPSLTPDGGSLSMVFSSHKNVYPTALPPYLPRRIAHQLLVWLETFVKDAVDGLVAERRLAEQRRAAAAEGQKKQVRAKSADSKGESPGKKRKHKKAKAPGLNTTGPMRRMGYQGTGEEAVNGV
ncbi:hypothetical protein L211DRAFT_889995 [Terfezia boudieri ATCC MYA-4762]|uniref:Uncharacterized protein n=1 Tax=Terfezia boudieri ATCC MYA-4762 TaxID=1051890 RepID=A0A3N4LTA9_9PEZI|nr:hypothetical protein L211DRAFT_889995 [Terfezia boudieri ATCC MYA-4762]